MNMSKTELLTALIIVFLIINTIVPIGIYFKVIDIYKHITGKKR